MNFLIIIGLVLALIVSFFFVWIKIIIKCDVSPDGSTDEGPIGVWLKILFFKIKLFPQKEKKINLKKYKIRNFRKMRRAEERKFRKLQKKEELKKKAKEDKKAAEAKASEEGKAPKKKKLSDNIRFVMRLLKGVVPNTLKKLYGYIHLEICRFDVKVATGDAAKTAMTYGVVSQCVSYILTLLYETSHTEKTKECRISVEPDFLGEKTEAHVLISLGLQVWHLPALAIRALIEFLKIKK